MRNPEHNARDASKSKTGFFATLSSPFRDRGSRAPAVPDAHRGLLGALCLLALALTGLLSSASSATAAETCPNAAIRQQQGSTALPDCRGYELVSPAKKYGYFVGGNTLPTTELGVAASGDRVTYAGANPIGEASSGSFTGVLGERDNGGWSASTLFAPPGPNQLGYGLPGFDDWLRGSTPDQRSSVYYDNSTLPYGSLWLSRPDGSKQKIVDASSTAGTSPGFNPGNPFFEGISADGRHVVFADTDALVPGITATGNWILYEWTDDGADGGAGTLRVVNRTDGTPLTLLDPAASASLGGGAADSTAWSRGSYIYRHAISPDGSRIYFQTPAPAEDLGQPLGSSALYLRTDGATTVEVSAPEPGFSPATSVQFLDASADGSHAFFWANGQLTATADPSGGIYRYDASNGQLTFLSTAPLINGLTFLPVPPTALASEDGSRLYFQRGPDVYVNDAGVNRLVLADTTITGSVELGLNDNRDPTANVSTPDGRYFAFQGGAQVYRYDDLSGAPAQVVSTSPSAPSSYTSFTVRLNVVNTDPRPTLTRFMSDDGQYVFFVTAAALVPQDTNGVEDAYEWHDGHVSLIGSGTNPYGSSFIGTDGNGANAFFVTSQPLALQDGDAATDIYDARINGGFSVAPNFPCAGDACQEASSPAPGMAGPGTANYAGPGNRNARKHRHKHKKKHHKSKPAARKHG